MGGFGYEYVEGSPWYKPTVEEASGMNLIPADIYAFNQAFKRGQMADLITRMMKYEDGTLNDYTGTGDSSYFVTYDSIDAGIIIDELLGTGQCVYGGELIEDGAVVDECICDHGSLECVEPI